MSGAARWCGPVGVGTLVLAACTGAAPGPADGSEATTAGEGPSTSAGSTAGGDSTHAPDATTSGPDGGSTDAPTSGDSMPGTDTGVMPPPPKSCALEVIDPAADPALVIDAGDGAGQIPTSVGQALLRNCGCHYTDDVPIGLYVDYVSNAQPMATLADFHGPFMGTFPMELQGMATYLAVQERVVWSNPLPMPPYGCGVEGEPGRISAADLQLLTDWLAAEAPDGASFP